MLTEKQKTVIEALKQPLNWFKIVNADEFIRKEQLGQDLSFELAKPLIEQVILLFRELGDVTWDAIPVQVIMQLEVIAKQALEFLERIRTFSATIANPVQERDSLITQLESNYFTWFTMVFPLTKSGKLSSQAVDFDLLKSEVNLALIAQTDSATLIRQSTENAKLRLEEEIAAIRKEATDEGKMKLQEIEAALVSVRRLASEAGVSQHAQVFDEEAKKLRVDSRIWMAAIAAFAVMIFLMAFHIIGLESWNLAPTAAALHASTTATASVTTSDFQWIKPVLEKVTFAFVLLFGLLWSARNYSASRHNEVINRHRMNALRSFETFAKAATDDQTKNAVLIQATQSIFSPQATGYVKTDGDNSSSSPIIELIRTASPGGKKD